MKGFRFLLLIGVSFVHFEAVTCQTNHPAASKPQRGKTLSSPILAHDLYQAYRELQSEYQTKAAKGDWKLLYEKEGVEVCLLQHPEDPTCPYVRMKGIFPVPVEECWNFLSLSNWDTSMPKMDPFYEGVSLHGSYQHDQVRMILCRKRTKRLLAFGKRDLVFLSVQDEPLSDGTWVSGTTGIYTCVPRLHCILQAPARQHPNRVDYYVSD